MSTSKFLILVMLAVAAAVMIGFVASRYEPMLLMAALAIVVIFLIAFLNTEAGLYILVFSMLLSPEIGLGPSDDSLGGRGFTLRLDDFLLVIIGFSWLAKNAIHKELGLFRKTPLNRPIAFYMTACLVATGIGVIAGRVNPTAGFFFVLKYFEYFIVFFMIVNHLETTDQIRRFVFCLFLTCFIASLIGIVQIPMGGRVSAPFEGESGEPNTFGGYLVFMGAVATGMLLNGAGSRTRWLLVALLIVMVPPFLFTESRASYLGAVPAALVLIWWSRHRKYLVAVMVLAVTLSPLYLPFQVKERVKYTFTQPARPEQQVEIGGVRFDTSTSARLRSWQEGLRDWTAHPLIGHGVTGYKFMDAQLPRVLVETGLLGFAAFLYLLYAIFKLAFDHCRRLSDPLHRGLVKGFVAGYVGLLFHAIGANTFIIVRIMEPFWFMAGIVVVLPALERAAAPAVDAVSPATDTASAARMELPRGLKRPAFLSRFSQGR